MKPRKVHELCDDLESFWFVLLFESLHFVKHNRPSGTMMPTLFDYVAVSPTTGTLGTGGTGKSVLYTRKKVFMTDTLKFDSAPFTALVRKMYLRFKALDAYYMAQGNGETPNDFLQENFRKMGSCADIKEIFEEALGSEEWPVSCDKVEDQYRPIGRSVSEQKDTIALSYASRSLVPPDEPSGGVKRKREEEEEGDTQTRGENGFGQNAPSWLGVDQPRFHSVMHVFVVVDALYLHTRVHVCNLVSCVFVPTTISRPLYILGKSLSPLTLVDGRS